MDSIELGIIITTTSSLEEAKKIAHYLVELDLAINVNLSQISSIYKEQGQICQRLECQLMIKTDLSLFQQIEARIIELNSAQVPEIIALPMTDVSHSYFNILVETTSKGVKHLVMKESPSIISEILPQGIKLEMVAIPAGTFMMGSNEYDKEKPIHEVKLDEFYMSKYPITQAQFQAVIGSNPSTFLGDNNPVDCVSWYLAQEFCERLSLTTGKKYQLPTEAQWEYACKAGTETKWHFGDDKAELLDYAWYGENSGSKTHPVGLKKANLWGLHDMHGNVWEWCLDNFSADYRNTPEDGSAYLDTESKNKILRGGSWYVNSNGCRSAGRFNRDARLAFNGNGFRVVINLS